jgi:YjbE family integral membrane protein
MLETFQAIIAIVLIDLTLAGDNALVIGMAARSLPAGQRRKAIVVGGAGAIVLRIASAAAVTLLLAIPYLQAIGALALIVIAYRLVRPTDGHGSRRIREGATLREAAVTIIVADAAMSLDNILGVGAAAHGSISLLIFGLALSIPIVLFGSDLIARLLDRFPQGVWLGVFALVWTAAEMLIADPALGIHESLPWAADVVITMALLVAIVAARGAANGRKRGARRPVIAEPGE